MQNISNRALISRLFTSANQNLEAANIDIHNWKVWYEFIQGLTDAEKMVYIIVKLNQSVTNGGFSEFYESSLGIFAPEIAHALQLVKAKDSAQLVNKSMSIINLAGLTDNDYKAFVFNIKLTGNQKMQLHSLDIQYDQLDGIENLEDLLGNYLQALIA
jgi:hypothetical protein